MKFEEELQKWETEFMRGYSKPFIMLALDEKPNYPYQIIKTINRNTKGKISIAGSNIYPILKKLEENGLILGVKDDETLKRVYDLTEDGKEFLVSLKNSMQDFVDIIQNAINKTEEG